MKLRKASVGLKLLLLVANLGLVVMYVSGWTPPPSQNNKKMVVRPLTVIKQPLDISIKHRGARVKENEEFDGDGEWLKNISLKIKNKTDKGITYIVLDLNFYPQATTNDQLNVGLHQIFMGIDPDRKIAAAEFRLGPNESVEVPLAERYEDIKKLVQFRLPIEQINQMTVRIHDVLFDDGTLFEVSTMYRRDPNDPRKWIKIDN